MFPHLLSNQFPPIKEKKVKCSVTEHRCQITSSDLSKNDWNSEDNLSQDLILGRPYLAIRKIARAGSSLRYGGSPSIHSIGQVNY